MKAKGDLCVAFKAGLRERRQAAGLSQAQLAEAVGITPAYVAQLEAGRTTPSMVVLAKIAKALDTTVGRLLGEHT